MGKYEVLLFDVDGTLLDFEKAEENALEISFRNHQIELNDKKEEEPFSTFIKGLAVDSRIDLETAKLILEKYKQEKGE